MTLIFIPTRSRFHKLAKSTLTQLPRDFDRITSVVCPRGQGAQYIEAMRVTGRKANVIECPVDGISNTRFWIGRTAQRLFQRKFILMDDDLINFAVRVAENDWHLRKATDEDLLDMYNWMDTSLDSYAHVSVSPRGNNLIRNSSGYFVGPKPLALENVRTIRILAYRTEEFLSVLHGRVQVMEDFDVNLQLLENGHKNIQSYWWTQDQESTSAPGGCSDYRSHQVHEESARKLVELHPNFVKLRTKVNKTGVKEFRERLEVTIAWKRAYESSQTAKVTDNAHN